MWRCPLKWVTASEYVFINFVERFSYDLEMKTREQNTKQYTNGIRAIWLVYRTDTNARGFWLVKQTHGWKNFMPENFPEINQYFALTSYCNTIGQSNNTFSTLRFSLVGKRRVHVLIFDKKITNTYRNHFFEVIGKSLYPYKVSNKTMHWTTIFKRSFMQQKTNSWHDIVIGHHLNLQ